MKNEIEKRDGINSEIKTEIERIKSAQNEELTKGLTSNNPTSGQLNQSIEPNQVSKSNSAAMQQTIKSPQPPPLSNKNSLFDLQLPRPPPLHEPMIR